MQWQLIGLCGDCIVDKYVAQDGECMSRETHRPFSPHGAPKAYEFTVLTVFYVYLLVSSGICFPRQN